MPWQPYLMKILPKAGLTYENDFKVNRQIRHDQSLFAAFQKAGVIGYSRAPRAKTAAKQAIDNTLASNIEFATSPHILNQLQDDENTDLGFFRFCDALKPHIGWAQHLSDGSFYDFIYALIVAGQSWQERRRPPFNLAEHSATARAIRAFLEAAGSRWKSAQVDFELFCMTGGLDESDEDKDENEGVGKESDIDMAPLWEALDGEVVNGKGLDIKMRTEKITTDMEMMDLD